MPGIPARYHPLAIKLALAVIAVSLITMLLSQCRRTPRMNKEPFRAQGEVVAEETARTLNHSGTVVILTMEMHGTVAAATAQQLAAFVKTLKGKTLVKVAGTETYVPTVTRDADGDPVIAAPGISGEFLLQALQRHPEAKVVVSFAGAPSLDEDQVRALGVEAPKIIVASNADLGERGALRQLFDARLALFAVIPRLTAPPSDEPQTNRELFDRFYQIVTPDQVDELAQYLP